MAEQIITFQTNEEEKQKIQNFAKEQSLAVASFCRFVILNFIKEKKQEAQN